MIIRGDHSDSDPNGMPPAIRVISCVHRPLDPLPINWSILKLGVSHTMTLRRNSDEEEALYRRTDY